MDKLDENQPVPEKWKKESGEKKKQRTIQSTPPQLSNMMEVV